MSRAGVGQPLHSDHHATPFENAQLNLQLFDLRREPVLREARSWFLIELNPESFADLLSARSALPCQGRKLLIGPTSSYRKRRRFRRNARNK